jgi:hypothetical protein
MLEEKLWDKETDEHIDKFTKDIVFSQSYFHFDQNTRLQIKSNWR